MSLNAKQKRFVQEYLIDLNQTKAAIRAGYSPRSANLQGVRMMANDVVVSEIKKIQDRRAKRFEVTADRVVHELAKIGFSNMLDYVEIGDDGQPRPNFSAIDRDLGAAIVECTVDTFTEGRGEDAEQVRRVRIKLADKRAALVDLAKHLGLYRESVDVNVNHTGSIEVRPGMSLDELQDVFRRVKNMTPAELERELPKMIDVKPVE